MKRENRESLPRSAKKKSPAESSSPAKIPTSEEVRRCAHCASEKTPQWRAGPSGPKTLCNACGVRYKSGRLVPEYRPAASPTFALTQHSNLHGKVMELRARIQAAALEFEPESDGIAQPERDAEAAGGGSLT